MLPNYHVKEKETQKTEETFVELKKMRNNIYFARAIALN